MSKKIVIVGGGPAGYEAALVASNYGAEIVVVEDPVSYTHLTLPTTPYV